MRVIWLQRELLCCGTLTAADSHDLRCISNAHSFGGEPVEHAQTIGQPLGCAHESSGEGEEPRAALTRSTHLALDTTFTA